MTEFTMPSNPADRKKIKDALYEMSGALQFIDDKRAFIKDVSETLLESFQIPKKMSTKLARTIFKNDYADVSTEADNFVTLFELLFHAASSSETNGDQTDATEEDGDND